MAVKKSLMDLMTKDFQARIFEVKYLFLGGVRKLLVWQLKYMSERKHLWYKGFLNVQSCSCFWRLSVSGFSHVLHWGYLTFCSQFISAYLGLQIHQSLIFWCRGNFSPVVSSFCFLQLLLISCCRIPIYHTMCKCF